MPLHSQQLNTIYFAFFSPPFQIRKRHNKWTGMLYISSENWMNESESDAGMGIFRKQEGKTESEPVSLMHDSIFWV